MVIDKRAGELDSKLTTIIATEASVQRITTSALDKKRVLELIE